MNKYKQSLAVLVLLSTASAGFTFAEAAGTTFTKISSSGQALPDSASQWSCVKDSNGLTWEVNTSGRPPLYSWYDPDAGTNGGDVGGQRNGQNTYAHIQAANSGRLCDLGYWRLPTLNELETLNVKLTPEMIQQNQADFAAGKDMSSGLWVDTNYFPNTGRELSYWSSETVSGYPNMAWGNYTVANNHAINIDGSPNFLGAVPLGKHYSGHVRLVHDKPPRYEKVRSTGEVLPASAPDFACIRDNETRLVWQKQTSNTTYDNLTSTSSPQFTVVEGKWVPLTYRNPTQAEVDSDRNSVGHLASLNSGNLCGYGSGWRLPTKSELEALAVDNGVASLQSNFFWTLVQPNAYGSDWYWSSTAGGNDHSAYTVGFGGDGPWPIHSIRGSSRETSRSGNTQAYTHTTIIAVRSLD